MPRLPKSRRPPWIPEKKQTPYSGDKFYHTPAWRNLRKKYIKEHPLCEECLRNGDTTPGYAVDHIVRIKDGGARLDENNLQTLCKRHHAIKTGKEAH